MVLQGVTPPSFNVKFHLLVATVLATKSAAQVKQERDESDFGLGKWLSDSEPSIQKVLRSNPSDPV